MNFSSDAMADFEGLLEVNRKICKQQMAEKASPTLPTNCAVLPKIAFLRMSRCGQPLLRCSTEELGQYRTNELVRRRMNFSSDAMADFEGLLEVNRKICQQQMAEKVSPTLPTNCAVLP